MLKVSIDENRRLHSSAQRKAMMSIAILSPSYNLIALRFAHQSLGASVPSDHLDTCQRLRTNLPIASAPAGNTWVPAEAHRRRTCR
jgi:hypothetical protein